MFNVLFNIPPLDASNIDHLTPRIDAWNGTSLALRLRLRMKADSIDVGCNALLVVIEYGHNYSSMSTKMTCATPSCFGSTSPASGSESQDRQSAERGGGAVARNAAVAQYLLHFQHR